MLDRQTPETCHRHLLCFILLLKKVVKNGLEWPLKRNLYLYTLTCADRHPTHTYFIHCLRMISATLSFYSLLLWLTYQVPHYRLSFSPQRENLKKSKKPPRTHYYRVSYMTSTGVNLIWKVIFGLIMKAVYFF